MGVIALGEGLSIEWGVIALGEGLSIVRYLALCASKVLTFV